jgi:hypothetical protein
MGELRCLIYAQNDPHEFQAATSKIEKHVEINMGRGGS